MTSYTTKSISYDARLRIFWAMAFVSVACIAVYIGAIEMTVHHTVAREALQDQSLALVSTVSQLEFQDIALKNGVSLDLAYAHGFKDVKAPTYISRSTANALSFNVLAPGNSR